jgi:hypothetical protein
VTVGRQIFRERRFGEGAKAVVAHVAPGRAEYCKIGREKPIGMERKERRQQHTLGQIAGGAEKQEGVGS